MPTLSTTPRQRAFVQRSQGQHDRDEPFRPDSRAAITHTARMADKLR